MARLQGGGSRAAACLFTIYSSKFAIYHFSHHVLCHNAALDASLPHHRQTRRLRILSVHGSFASSRWWQPLFDLLPEEVLYGLALDLRGCGASDKPDAGYTIEEQAADLAAFVDALGCAIFDLVAHSSGGAIAIEYVLGHRGMARTLTLVDSALIEGVFTPLEGLHLLEQMRSLTASC